MRKIYRDQREIRAIRVFLLEMERLERDQRVT